ncbi:MAG: MerC domain-containing protein [Oligoflexales bacterium]|nr:MerC domain-containing protein [Oligoflexales bacterium]
MVNIQAYTDKLAIGLSVLWTIHCLLFPVLIVLLPSLASYSIADDELFHQWMIAGVLPISVVALTLGCRKHGSFAFLGLGFLGVFFLTVAAFLGHELVGESGEKLLTLLGAGIIAIAHYKNSRICQSNRCC